MNLRNLIGLSFVFVLMEWCLGSLSSQQTVAITAVNRPEKVPFKQEYLSRLKLPPGFEINVFADNLGKPRMLAVRDDGGVYVTRPSTEDVVLLQDTNGDGRADQNKTVAQNIKLVHGIALHNDKLYLCGEKELYSANLDGTNLKRLISDLPDGAQHPNRTIQFGPDGMLYISVGSTCNACKETNPEHATILRSDGNSAKRTVVMKGLRNTIGFGWHPKTKQMWGMDHGSDERGDDLPPEELNQLEKGDYGWPYCFDKKQVDPRTSEPEGTTKEAYCQQTKGSTLGYQAHSAPIAMVFYNGKQFPAEFNGDAFIAMHGSWNRKTPVGYKVVRLKFKNGQPIAFEDFVTGFLIDDGQHQFGRPAGVTVHKDGSLLFSDDNNGVIYRVFYKKNTASK